MVLAVAGTAVVGASKAHVAWNSSKVLVASGSVDLYSMRVGLARVESQVRALIVSGPVGVGVVEG
jgi:hypothetical protein